jgi:hypothetical protein
MADEAPWEKYGKADSEPAAPWEKYGGKKDEKPEAPKKSMGQSALEFGRDVAAGFGGAALSPIVRGGDVIRRMTGQKRIIQEPDVQRLIAPIPTAGGQVGNIAEQTAELFLMPELKAGAPLAVRSGVEALKLGGQAAAHGESVPAGMIGGAAGPVIGAGLRSLGKGMSEGAQHLYMQALNPTKQITKGEALKVTPELMDRGFWASTFPKYVEQSRDKLAGAASSLDAAWKSIPAGTRIDTTPVLDSLRADIRKLAVGGQAPTPQAQAARRQILDQFSRIARYGKSVSAEDARAIRQLLDRAPAKKGAFVVQDAATTALEEAQERAGNALRNEINKIPQVAKENAEYSFWKKVNHIAEATDFRKIGQKGLLPMLVGPGVVAGEIAAGKKDIGDVPGMLKDALLVNGAFKLATATGTKQLSSFALNALAEQLGKRDLGKFFEAASIAVRPKASPWQAPPVPGLSLTPE